MLLETCMLHLLQSVRVLVVLVVVYINSGKSPRLKSYYAHWEKKIFDAISKECYRSDWCKF